jgi:hypothetical protein
MAVALTPSTANQCIRTIRLVRTSQGNIRQETLVCCAIVALSTAAAMTPKTAKLCVKKFRPVRTSQGNISIPANSNQQSMVRCESTCSRGRVANSERIQRTPRTKLSATQYLHDKLGKSWKQLVERYKVHTRLLDLKKLCAKPVERKPLGLSSVLHHWYACAISLQLNGSHSATLIVLGTMMMARFSAYGGLLHG